MSEPSNNLPQVIHQPPNTERGMLDPTAHVPDPSTPIYPTQVAQEPMLDATIWQLITVAGVILGLLGVFLAFSEQQFTTSEAILSILGIGMILTGYTKIGSVERENQQRAGRNDEARLHMRHVEDRRIDTRQQGMHMGTDMYLADGANQTELFKTKMQTDADILIAQTQAQAEIEKAKYGAIGESGALATRMLQTEQDFDRQMKILSAKQGHESSEAALNRQARLDQMITRFQGELEALGVRMEFENPSAQDRIQERIVLMKGALQQAEEINTIDDPVLRKQMWDKFNREWEDKK